MIDRSLTQDKVESELSLRTVYDALTCGVVVWNTLNQIVEANKAAQDILGTGINELRNYLVAPVANILARPDGTPLAYDEWPFRLVFTTGQAQHNMLLSFTRPNGQHRWLQMDAVPVKEEGEKIIQVVSSFIDVTERIEAEYRALENEQRLQAVISNAPVIFLAVDRKGIITFAQGKGRETLGRKPRESVGNSIFEMFSEFPKILDALRRALAGETFTEQVEIYGQAFEARLMPMFGPNNEVTGSVCVAINVTERVQAEEALRVSEQRFRALTERASDLVLISDAMGIYRYASPSHLRIVGYTPEELLGTNIFDLIHPDDLMQIYTRFATVLQMDGMQEWATCRVRHANGKWVTIECVGHNCLADPAIEGIIINARDITERVAIEEILRHQARYDILTDLPNRALLLERLDWAIVEAQLAQSEVALLMMGIERFKEISDTFGHQHGDLLLQQVGTRLQKAIAVCDMAARLGGDEFAILLPAADEAITLNIIAELLKAIEEPFTVEGNPLEIEVSIGIALYPRHGSDALTLLRRADIAMYMAKRAHEGFAFYDAGHDQDSTRSLALFGALRNAIANQELALYYQPKAEVKSGAVLSVEALARWIHPTFGFISPDQFIPIAERTGLITPLTRWVMETAIRQCRDWLHNGLDISVAINLSMWNLRDATLPDTIAALLQRYKVPPRLLRVELTESAMMADMDRALDVLLRLSALGVHASIDDFGTGYSSLAYLKILPVDELKIDRSFVQHITNVEADAAIVRSTVELAHNLGLRVVAEGVEDLETLHLLASLKCDAAQGFYLSRPIPPQDFESWLRKTKQVVAN